MLYEVITERTVEHLEARRSTSRPKAAAEAGQLGLFGGEPPVVQALREVKLETLTPLDALNLIAEWKKHLTGGAG